MAKQEVEAPDQESTDIEDVEELEEDLEVDDLEEDLEDELDDDVEGDESAEGAASTKEDHDEETEEALEELESQELQLLEDEASEALLIDEVQEIRAMRREELTMNVDAQGQKSDEFVCQSCFMVKRISQLANKRKMICQDCVA